MGPARSDVPTEPAQPPARADARRNYDALLAAADEAFTRDGVDTSLEDIARRAGVAIGTLYRNFPTREVLLEAVFRDELAVLRARADELAEHPSPGTALFSWLDELGTHATTYRGLARSILSSFQDETSVVHRAHSDMREAAHRLLVRAQEAGAVRDDVDLGHVLSLTCALSSASEGAPGDAGRLRAVVYAGLRA